MYVGGQVQFEKRYYSSGPQSPLDWRWFLPVSVTRSRKHRQSHETLRHRM